MEASTIALPPRSRVRRWLRGDGPPSRGAQLFLFVSALLCGAAVSGLLFAGIWRHTAGEAARNHSAQLGDHRALIAAKHDISGLKTRLARNQQLLAQARSAGAALTAQIADTKGALEKTRRTLVQARHTLAKANAARTAARTALHSRLQALTAAANGLVRQTATIRSELNALESYASAPGPAGVDPGYVASQTHYLIASATSAASAAGELVRQAQALSAG